MKSADYHDEMNATEHFTEWWTDKLLSNLPEGAVIVMDNAPYHTVKTDAIRGMSRCIFVSESKLNCGNVVDPRLSAGTSHARPRHLRFFAARCACCARSWPKDFFLCWCSQCSVLDQFVSHI